MEAFFVSLGSVALAEVGDRTQLLALLLITRYRQPLPVLAGILVATLANHAVAGAAGIWLGGLLTPMRLQLMVGIGLVAMGLWTLKPDQAPEQTGGMPRAGVLLATIVAFFLAEFGDKTQIATLALAAAYANLPAVVAGTTMGMLVANAPVVLLGHAVADRLPLRLIRGVAALAFIGLGILFLLRALA